MVLKPERPWYFEKNDETVVAGVLGGLLLSLPVSLQRVHELSMVDNLFMAFSAVCITGLAVTDLAPGPGDEHETHGKQRPCDERGSRCPQG